MNGETKRETGIAGMQAYALGQTIAAAHGKAGDSELARWAGLLSAHLLEGRVYLNIKSPFEGLEVIDESMKLPDPVPDWLEVVVDRMPASGAQPIVMAGDYLWLARYYDFNCGLRMLLNQRRERKPALLNESQLKADLKVLFPDDENTNANQGQLLAAANLVDLPFGLLTGGPGTGKTTSLAKLLLLWLRQKEPGELEPILLCAPTGKAAARLRQSLGSAIRKLSETLGENQDFAFLLPLLNPDSESCLVKTQTIHSALGMRSARREGMGPFWRGKANRLRVSMVIVDEVSMVDLALMKRLVDAVPDEAPLYFVGDIDQLESVEAGSVLPEITRGKQSVPEVRLELTCRRAGVDAKQIGPGILNALDHVHLTYVHRYAKGSLIGELAKAVNEGRATDFMALLQSAEARDQGLSWVNLAEPCSFLHEIMTGPAGYGALAKLLTPMAQQDAMAVVTAFEQFRVLCAIRKGPDGVERWNERLQQWVVGSTQVRFVPRAVMITANDPGSGLCNGDSGMVLPDGDILRFYSSDGKQMLASQLPAFEPGWAITIHKSQGSEYESVAIVLPRKGGTRLIKRRLLYTGLTRARKKVVIVATEKALREAIETV